MSTLLAFVVTLCLLIIVHEYGHYRVARLCGVKVLRFSVGFGRVIWRRQNGPDATEFTLCLLPLGGYVRMLEEREGPVPSELTGQAFNNRPLRQRVAIVAAGPLANLLLAVLLFASVNWIGLEEPKALLGAPLTGSVAERAGMRAGDWVQASSTDGQEWQELQSLSELSWRLTEAVEAGRKLHLNVSNADGHGRHTLVLDTDRLDGRELDAQSLRKIGLGGPFSAPLLGKVSPGGAGDQAGLKSGDLVQAVDGALLTDAATLRRLIRSAVLDGDARTMLWRIERAGQVLELPVTPKVLVDAGKPIGRLEVMVGAAPALVTVRYGFFDGLLRGFERTTDMSWMTLKMFGRMLVGEASLQNLSGPLAIADYAGQSVRMGLAHYLGFLGLLSVSLGVLNLLPLPMLDGGHLMYYCFEGITGRAISEWWQTQLQRAGALILILMMALALSNDVVRLTGLH